MKKEECLTLIDEIIPDITREIKVRAKRLLDTGAIDIDYYGSDYRLPRILLTVILEDLAGQYYPISDRGIKEVKNLHCF